MTAALIEHWVLSGRALLVEIKGRPFNVRITKVYAPTADSSEDIENFYGQLDQTKTQCKLQDILINMGDFDAKVGKGRCEDIVGSYGLGLWDHMDWENEMNEVINFSNGVQKIVKL